MTSFRSFFHSGMVVHVFDFSSRRLKQEDYKVEVSLGYTAKHVSKNKTKNYFLNLKSI